jgi:electron transport complex protein RnfG
VVERPEVPSWRLILTLALAGALAGFLLVFVNQATAPAIAKWKAEQLALAVNEVLKEPARYDTLYLVDGTLTAQLPEGVDPKKLEAIYLGFDADGGKVGYAMAHREAGFQDFIKLIFGYDVRANRLLGMKILESKETPGLGDKIYLDLEFVDQFDGVEAKLTGVKKGERSKKTDVEMITGATISSKAVIRIINNAIDRWRPYIEAFEG